MFRRCDLIVVVMSNFLSAQQVKLLDIAHKATKNKKKADRIKAILAANNGFTHEEIARILRLDDSTTRRYIKDFEEKGIIVRNQYIGKPGRLSKEQEAELKAHVKENLYACADEIAVYVGKEYRIMYSQRGMIKLLKRLGFSYKKTDIVPGKADKQKQETFIKQYQQLQQQMGPEDRVYFVDAAHPHHNTRSGYAWIYVGERQEVASNTGRERVNLNGAIALPTEKDDAFRLIVEEEPTVNDEAMIRLIEQIKEQQPRGKIYLIEDNARYNHSYLMQAYIEQEERVEIMFLPAYSPNLNLIERLWKFYYEKVVQHQYYQTIQEFRGATHTFFTCLTQTFEEELQSRITDNFQIIGV